MGSAARKPDLAEQLMGGTVDEIAAAQNAAHDACGRVRDACVCSQPVDHDGPCICECGGAWDGAFVVRFPRGGMFSAILPVPQPGARFRMVGPLEWEPVDV